MRDEILNNYRQTMIEERGRKLKAVTQTILTLIATLDSGREMYVEGEQLKVKMLIDQTRYEDDSSGYFWVNDNCHAPYKTSS